MADTRSAIYDEISTERDRQDAKFGEQNHPDGVDTDETSIMIANQWRDMVNQRLADGTVTWMDILFEEAYEAGVEADPAKLRAEVVQIAAVAVAWLECIDRRSTK
jgi:hypothetical protein